MKIEDKQAEIKEKNSEESKGESHCGYIKICSKAALSFEIKEDE